MRDGRNYPAKGLQISRIDCVMEGFLQFLADAANTSSKEELSTDDLKKKLGLADNTDPIIRAGIYQGTEFAEFPNEGSELRKKMGDTIPFAKLKNFIIEMEIGTDGKSQEDAIKFADALGENSQIKKLTGVRIDDNFKSPDKPTICISGGESIHNAYEFIKQKQLDRQKKVVNPVLENPDLKPKIAPRTNMLKTLTPNQNKTKQILESGPVTDVRKTPKTTEKNPSALSRTNSKKTGPTEGRT